MKGQNREDFVRKFTIMNDKRISRLFFFTLFIIFFLQILISITYLFRNADGDRLRIVGIKEEEELDVIYIGGSAAFVYWQPLKAWNEYGFTSYNYAVNSLQAEGVQNLIKESMKTHSPELFVIDLRPFQYWKSEFNEGEPRRVSDKLDYSWNRFDFLFKFVTTRDYNEEIDYLSLFLEVAKYHSNLEALADPNNWKRINNEGKAAYKGWETNSEIQYFEEPSDFYTEEKEEIPQKLVKILEELMEYCSKEELEVLFVVCPYVIEKEHQIRYNTLKEIIENNGFQYINTNEYYEDMGIDFSTDFYDRNHVNIGGAEKYTAFLAEYISSRYALPDHRKEKSFLNWDWEYKEFEKEVDIYKTEIQRTIAATQLNIELAKEMKKTTSLQEWGTMAFQDGFTVLFIGSLRNRDLSVKDQIFFRQLGLEDSIFAEEDEGSYIGVINGGDIEFVQKMDSQDRYDGLLNENTGKEKAYSFDIPNNSILIDNVEYGEKKDEINIIVYDNHFGKVVDSVSVVLGKSGELELER